LTGGPGQPWGARRGYQADPQTAPPKRCRNPPIFKKTGVPQGGAMGGNRRGQTWSKLDYELVFKCFKISNLAPEPIIRISGARGTLRGAGALGPGQLRSRCPGQGQRALVPCQDVETPTVPRVYVLSDAEDRARSLASSRTKSARDNEDKTLSAVRSGAC
jgi:hypothetical protein